MTSVPDVWGSAMHRFTRPRFAWMWLRRAGFHIAAPVVAVALALSQVTGHGPPSATVRTLTIPVALTAAMGESPTTLGVADSELYRLSDAEIDATLDRLKALGVNDIRVAVPWIYIQAAGDDEYDWAKMDAVVRAADARDMNIVGTITGTPGWAGFPINGHSDPADYARFAAAVADRYKDGTIGEIDTYEVWNEPNGALFYNPVDAAAYTAMLQAAYPAIKTANPDAVVLAGVLGSVATLPGLSLKPDTFVAQMYDSGAHGYFDALSFHPYHYTLPFSRGADVDNSPVNQVAAIRALMAAHGDGAVKIWVTEYGLPTNPQISEAQQAAFIRDFVVTWQGVDGAGPVFIYSTRDSASGAFDDEQNFGLYYTDWTPKQAALAVQDLIEDLADGTAEPFDVTPFLPTNSFVDGVLILARQIVSLLSIVPRALYEFAVSAVTAVVQTIGTVVRQVLGQGTPAAVAGDDETDDSTADEVAVSAARTDEDEKEPAPVETEDTSEPAETVDATSAADEDSATVADEETEELTEEAPAPPEQTEEASEDDEPAEDADEVGDIVDVDDEAAETDPADDPDVSEPAEKEKSGRADTP